MYTVVTSFIQFWIALLLATDMYWCDRSLKYRVTVMWAADKCITIYILTIVKAINMSKKITNQQHLWYLCSCCSSSAATCGVPSRRWNLALARINIGRLLESGCKQHMTTLLYKNIQEIKWVNKQAEFSISINIKKVHFRKRNLSSNQLHWFR